MHVVDTKVQRWTYLKAWQHAKRGHPAGGVHQRGQGTAMHCASLRVADDGWRPGQEQRHAIGVRMLDAHLQHLTMFQCR
ncbi:hypothetical protein D3C76_1536930 [compost metagenome]